MVLLFLIKFGLSGVIFFNETCVFWIPIFCGGLVDPGFYDSGNIFNNIYYSARRSGWSDSGDYSYDPNSFISGVYKFLYSILIPPGRIKNLGTFHELTRSMS